MKITILKDAASEYRFRIVSSNNEIVAASSEGYNALAGCFNGLVSTIQNIQNPAMIKRKIDRSDAPFYTINAPNGRILTKSESFSSKQAMEKGLAALQKIFHNPFEVVNSEGQKFDPEFLLKHGIPVHGGSGYQIKIDNRLIVIPEFGPTGAELLKAINKDPKRFELIQKFTLGRTEVVQSDERVDLRVCGVEKFVTIPLDQTNGKMTDSKSLADRQRDFLLLEEDIIFLESNHYTYDLIKEGNKQWLVIRDYLLPAGYQVERTNIALLLPTNYPDTQIDMVYCFPFLERQDKKAIPRTQVRANISGKQYQGWSRHRTRNNPWRRGIDNICTHLHCVDSWLRKEVL